MVSKEHCTRRHWVAQQTTLQLRHLGQRDAMRAGLDPHGGTVLVSSVSLSSDGEV